MRLMPPRNDGDDSDKMNVVGISGSPRRHGSTETLLDRLLEGAVSAGADVEKIVLNELTFRPCQECGGCDRTGACVIKDDMEFIYRRIEDADGIVVASPVFFANVSAQTKMMIDRFQCAWVAKYALKKERRTKKQKGIFISVSAAHRKDFFDSSKLVVKSFFATLDIEYAGELLCGGITNKSDIDSNEKLLKSAFELGKSFLVKI
ncbi:MAG: flavodoxin family protein [Candidatus Omnitrophica bacterium]|nr:flavodoxin family protein [Candidatus Omnitrophota bacterium]